ncbi:MAG: FtsX-like permease family protein [Ignavibacterium album]|uniref:ABC transporter permease n=1 Tax=Ignavibacterium album TaxID=591197 RepID=UPI0026F1CDA1|nr:FtsX-like permease family protein [Ignavibacterium album]MCX8105894.1 FtsX-like permease family protein [Ignavibacterium album]
MIIIFAALFGIWGGVFTNGVFVGMWETTIETAINREYSHIQIHHPNFRDEKLIYQSIQNIQELEKFLNSNKNIKSFSNRTIIEGIASSPTSVNGVKIVAINPEKEKLITSIHQKVIEGIYFGNRNYEILIGRKLAERLKVKLNSKVVLSFQGMDTNLVASAFRVVGIFKTESKIFDETQVFIKQNDLTSILGQPAPIHEVAIRVKSSDLIDTTTNLLKQQLSNLKVESWKELAPELSLTSGFLYLELNIFMGIILFALLFGISNTMMMSVFERIREFGVLIAIGMKRIRLFILIIFESLILLFSGGLLGTFLGFVTIQLLSQRGIDLSMVEEGMAAYGMAAILYPKLPFHMYVSLFLMMIVTAILASLSPAIKAIRLKPAEAIRTYI